jgi:parvulin-like peptidyl-prolyl isomerase
MRQSGDFLLSFNLRRSEVRKVSLLVLAGVILSALFSGCGTQEQAQVVARVGDREITVDEMQAQWKQASRLKIQGVSELQRKKELVDKLVGDQVVIMEAYKEGLDNQVDNDPALADQKNRIILSILYQKEIADKCEVSESEMRREYERTKEEIHAAHILVETEPEAEEIYEDLKGGADFGELAKERSIDPTVGTNQGDLGFFTWGKMVPEFQEAAFAMQEGEISKPVKTTYGWHVIKLIERREKEQPPFEESKDLIKTKLTNEKREKRVKEYFSQLRKKVDFTLNPDAYQLLLSKRDEVPPDTLGLNRPGDILDLERFTPAERDLALFTYNSGSITVKAFADQFNQMPQAYRPRLQEQDKVIETAFGLVVQDLLLDLAQKQNLESSEEFKSQWTGVKEREMGMRMTNQVILKDVGISDQEVESYYNQHIDRFTIQPQVKVREILVQTEEEAKNLLGQLKGGTDFAKLAMDKTIRTYVKSAGGLLGSFPRTRYPEIFDATQNMKVGNLGGPIKINDRQFGETYSVIKLEDRTEGKVQTLDEVKDRVTSLARQEKDRTIFQNWVQNAKSLYKIEIYEDVIQSTIQEPEEEPVEQG